MYIVRYLITIVNTDSGWSFLRLIMDLAVQVLSPDGILYTQVIYYSANPFISTLNF